MCPAAAEATHPTTHPNTTQPTTQPKLSLDLDCGRPLTPADALAGAFAISRSRDPADLGGLVLSYTPAVPQASFPGVST